jgi:4-amino-4-deoxy-L-arabinose transferase-like glycosyltransferase
MRIAAIAMAAYLIAVVPALKVYPLVFEDEVTLDEPARELAFTGHLRSSYIALSNPSKSFDRCFFWQPPGQALMVASSYKLFGFGIWQTRLPGLACAALCVLLMGLVCGELGCAVCVLAGDLFLILNPQFFRTATNARMDTLCWMFLLASLFVYLRFCQRERYHAVLSSAVSGLLVGLACMAHPLAVSWAIGFNIIIFLRKSGIKAWLLFNVACALPTAAWLAWAYPHWSIFVEQFLRHGASRMATGGLLSRLFAEAQRTLVTHGPAPLYLLAIFFGLFAAVLKVLPKSKPPRDILILALVVGCFVTLFMGKQSGEYNAYYFIPFAVLSATGLEATYASSKLIGRRLLKLSGLIVVCWSMARLVSPIIIANTVQAQARDYALVERQLDALLPKGTEVWGSPEAWYAVIDNGGVLRELAGTPDPKSQKYLILPHGLETVYARKEGYVKVGSVGNVLPAFFGKTFSSNDYRLVVWRSSVP